MNHFMFSQEGSKALTLKELAEGVWRALFLGESVSDPRNAEINKAFYAAIILKHLIGLNQFANDPQLQKEVREISGDIQSILSKYQDSEAKDIDSKDLDALLEEMKKLPPFSVIKENTLEIPIMNLNIAAQAIAIIKKAIPRLSDEYAKRNAQTVHTLKPN